MTAPFGPALVAALKRDRQGGTFRMAKGRVVAPRFFCCLTGTGVGVMKDPVAILIVDPIRACTGDNITADGCSSWHPQDPAFTITNYIIDWGDGNDTGWIAWGACAPHIHAYAAAGIYTITLTVQDGHAPNLYGTDTVTVEILDCLVLPLDVWAGCGSSGVWRSADCGLTWIQRGLAGMQVYCMSANQFTLCVPEPDPLDPYSAPQCPTIELWVATAEGLYRTINSGDNWERMDEGMDLPANAEVAAVLCSKFDPEEVFALVHRTVPARELYLYRTINSGENWDAIEIFGVWSAAWNQTWAFNATAEGWVFHGEWNYEPEIPGCIWPWCPPCWYGSEGEWDGTFGRAAGSGPGSLKTTFTVCYSFNDSIRGEWRYDILGIRCPSVGDTLVIYDYYNKVWPDDTTSFRGGGVQFADGTRKYTSLISTAAGWDLNRVTFGYEDEGKQIEYLFTFAYNGMPSYYRMTGSFSGWHDDIAINLSAVTLTANAVPIDGRQHIMDMSADGQFVYLGLLDNAGVPVLMRVQYDLTAVAEIMTPAAGTWIGAKADYNYANRVWAFGDYTGAEDRLAYSDDWGETWTDVDIAAWAGDLIRPALPSILDPNDIVVIQNTGAIAHAWRTLDAGTNWTDMGAIDAANITAACAERDYLEPLNIFVGRVAVGANHLRYSPNAGSGWLERSGGITVNAPITAIIVTG